MSEQTSRGREPAAAVAGFPALLRARAAGRPGGIAYVFLGGDADEDVVTYRELDRRARALAVRFGRRARPGQRALLLCAPGREYVEAFFGCLYAGLIAVPAYPPRGPRDFERVADIVRDCEPALGITDTAGAALLGGTPGGTSFAGLTWASTADEDEAGGYEAGAGAWAGPEEDADAIAFLQYTSGSTASPRGVVLSHRNLVHNAAVLARTLGLGPEDRSVSWLPPYHDMGLIGAILQPLHSGFPGTLMTPMAFLRDPAAWLRAVGRARATVCAAPTFAYEECVRRVPDEVLDELDLSAWRYALVGAEPVRADTLRRFARRFGRAGFGSSAFYPCYGLAEATLFVTGAEPGAGATATAFAADALAAGQAVPSGEVPYAEGVSSGRGPDAEAVSNGPGPQTETRGQGSDAAGGPGGAVRVLVSCGRARDADTVLVVDPRTRRPAAAGTVGEIWVSGPTVARGYWGRPRDTEEVFRARLDGDERTFLRTGDLGFEHDGDLYVAGRSKDLIVVRGRNLYPQDLEATAQRAHPALRPNRLIAFGVDGDGQGEQVVLVGEVSGPATGDEPAVIDAIRRAVATEHGVRPADVVLVDRGGVPRTSSGKVRRSACRDRYLAGTLPVRLSLASAPAPAAQDATTPPEAVLARVAAVLDVPATALRADAPLVAQGLDSLRAAELLTVVRDEFGTALALDDLFGAQPLGDLVTKVAGGAETAGGFTFRPPDAATVAASRATVAASHATADRDAGPATPGEQRLFTLHRLGASAAYHLAGGIRFRGRLDVEALRSALDEVRRRNPSLRTTFEVGGAGADEGGLRRVVRPWRPEPLEVADLTGDPAVRERAAAVWHERLALRPFDLEHDAPARFALARLADDEYVLAAVFHHIAVDGWSVRRIARQLEEAYEAAADGTSARPLRAAVVTPPAAGLNPSPAAGPNHDAPDSGLAFWLRTLDGVPDLALDTDRPRAAQPSFAGGTLPVELEPALMDEVRALARAEGATPFMVVLAAFAVLLARRSGQDRFVVGVPYASRRAGDEETRYAVNTLPLALDTSGDPAFRDLLALVRARALAAYEHAGTPFERIVHERARRTGGRGRQDALIRAMLALNSHPVAPWRQRGLLAEPFELPLPAAMCDLSLHLADTPTGTPGGGVRGHLAYASALFDEVSALGLRSGLRGVLRTAVAAPGRRLSALSAAEGPERDLLLGELSGIRQDAVFEGRVDAMFERQAAATPDATAVVCAGDRLTYRRLDADADRLARHLRELGVPPGGVVAVHLHRSPALPTALLAVLKAGAAYLPLDPQHPAGRLEAVLADARPALVVTSAATLAEPHAPRGWRRGRPDTGVPVLDLDAAAAAVARQPAGRPAAAPHPDGPAYVIHTSGSTGTPKGVVNTHRGLANYLKYMGRRFGTEPGGAVLQNTALGFDVSIGELLWPLVSGGRLVLPRPAPVQEPGYLARLIVAERVRVCTFVPSTLRLFLAAPGAGECAGVLRDVITLGEDAPADLVEQFRSTLPGSTLHNHYGPAEASVVVTGHQVPPGFHGPRVPIGRPIPGARAYVLDDALAPVPVGTRGDLYLAGACLALGYLGRPAATAAAFLPNPFEPGTRIYRTGDLARRRPDGELEYLGRSDRQVKIRGQRIEPGDVEHALGGHPAVSACAVRAVKGADGGRRLAAYVVAAGSEPPAADLRAHLAARLPRFMVPADFVFLPRLPLGPTGKVSHRDLPDPAPARDRRDRPPVPPSNPAEQGVARIFSRLLDAGTVGADDDFYDLGGHSLLAIRIVAAVRDTFHVELDVADLLIGDTTVAGLARLIVDRQVAQAGPDELRGALARLRALSDEEAAALVAEGMEQP